MHKFTFRCKNCHLVFHVQDKDVRKEKKIWEGGLEVTYVYAKCPNPECQQEATW